MAAAHQITQELVKRLRGKCGFIGNAIIASDGALHSDCSTCHAKCGGQVDLGVPNAGFTLERDLEGLLLIWLCPQCKAKVSERTSIFTASTHSKQVALDSLCHKCRSSG